MSTMNIPRYGDLPNFVGRDIGGGLYRLDRIYESGTSGVIYIATERETMKMFACKCIYAPTSENEAESHSACSQASRGVVNVHSVILDEELGYTFIIMDFCGYGNLFFQMTQKRFVPARDEYIKNIFLQILDAVEDCHKIGIFHRDLKPDNILLKNNGNNILITDFGNATTEGSSNNFDFGFHQFMPPEIIAGHDNPDTYYSPRHVDLWALGMILFYICCAGYLPWVDASFNDPRYLYYTTQNADYLFHFFPVSRQLNHLLKQILVPDPLKRMSISQMKDEIRNMGTFFSFVENGTDWKSEVQIQNIDAVSGFAALWNRQQISKYPGDCSLTLAVYDGEDVLASLEMRVIKRFFDFNCMAVNCGHEFRSALIFRAFTDRAGFLTSPPPTLTRAHSTHAMTMEDTDNVQGGSYVVRAFNSIQNLVIPSS